MRDRGIARVDAVYVGDRSGDGESADANWPSSLRPPGYSSLGRADSRTGVRWPAPALADAILGDA